MSSSKPKAIIQAHTWFGIHDRTSSMSYSLDMEGCRLFGLPRTIGSLSLGGVSCPATAILLCEVFGEREASEVDVTGRRPFTVETLICLIAVE
jgi:hypothetical protein